MTKENAKELLPFIKAYSEGKQIQVFYDNKWQDKDEFSFNSDPSNYRIKLEPKYRPFKNIEECWQEMHKHSDFGWLKVKEEESYCNIGSIYESPEIAKVYIDTCEYDFSDLFNNFTFVDGSPFGVKEK